MVLEETTRRRLARRLEEVLGDEHAEALMAELATIRQVATLADLHALEERLDQRLDRRMDERFAAFEQRMDDKLTAAKFEVIATLRGELVAQTRTMIFTMAGTVAALGGLAVALARFG